jgi:hypothetical protein
MQKICDSCEGMRRRILGSEKRTYRFIYLGMCTVLFNLSSFLKGKVSIPYYFITVIVKHPLHCLVVWNKLYFNIKVKMSQAKVEIYLRDN